MDRSTVVKVRMSEGCCGQTVVSPSKQNPGAKVPLIEIGVILQASQHTVCGSGKRFTDPLDSSVCLAFLIVNSVSV